MNIVILIGRLVAAPELKYTQANIAMCSFRLAEDRRYKNQQGNEETDFIDCVAWRQQAEFMTNYLEKGSLIAVQGQLQVRSWQAQDGTNRRTVEVIVENVQSLGRKSQSDGYNAAPIPSVAPPDPYGVTEGIPDWTNASANYNSGNNNFSNDNNNNYNNNSQPGPMDGMEMDPFADD